MSAAKKIIHRYFHQLITGCGNSQCSNIYCRSSSSFKYDKTTLEDPNRVAAEAIRLNHESAPLCFIENKKEDTEEKINIDNLTENNLKELIDECEKINDWNALSQFIELVFSNRVNLSTSFLKESFSVNIPNKSQTSSAASATPKSFFIYDPCVKLDNDEITLDFDSMKRTIKLLKSYEDQIASTIHTSLNMLLNQLKYEMTSKQHELETDANFFNIFFIIFELSYLSDPMFLFDLARLFYLILTNLSITAQAKFVRLSSKYVKNLDDYVSHVQQYITLHTSRWCDRIGMAADNDDLLSKEAGMKEGLNALRLLFYANLLGGQRDSPEIIEIERKSYEKTENELFKRRQRQSDGFSDDEEHHGNEQMSSDRENVSQHPESSAATTSSTTTASSATAAPSETAATAAATTTTTETRKKTRKSTNEDDDIKSPYENTLQIELGLKPNEYRCGQYSYDIFVNDYANEKLEIKKEYLNFIQQPNSSIEFSFIFYPFFLSTVNKIALLSIESKARMFLQRRSIFVHNIFSPIRLNPVFKINVRRNHLIEDALISLEYQGIEQPEELKKQLFVEFEGEQGHDEGGLSKEFFQLITEQIFSPEYAMFMTNEETRCLWFNPSAAEDLDREYTLIGMLFGLAIYNSIILDIKFPPILYRKLLGKLGTFDDLETSHPTIYRSLKSLLAFDETEQGTTVEETFGLTFQVAITDAIGTRISFDLKENGENISVTNDNREEFVHLYSDILLNKSIQKQFDPFFHGFLLVTHDSSLRKLFRADEIDLLVAGSQILDFNQLASAAEYDGGYSKDSPTIKNFWTVLMTFNDEQKRKFLRFTTGSDRAPIGGLARLKLIISRNGPDTDRLPTAHTCFNALLLPDYSSIEKLQEKLSIAIDNAEGFGLR